MNDAHPQADAYVVGALSSDEAQDFEAHLAECLNCTKEVADMRDVTARLSEAVAADPPIALRASVLASIAVTVQDRLESEPKQAQTRLAEVTELPATQTPPTISTDQPEGDRANHSSGRHAGPAAAGDEQTNVVPLQRSRASRVSALLAAAAVLAAIGFGGWAIQSRNSADQALAQTQQLTQVLGASDVQTSSGTFSDGGAGTVVRSRSQGTALFIASNLPDLPADKVYEAWTVSGQPVPAGTFTPEGSNTTVRLPDAALDAKSLAVTIEPGGGSQQPTTEPIFTVNL